MSPVRYSLGHDVGECVVGLAIRVPADGLDRHAVDQVVKQRPEHAVGEPVVVAFDVFTREFDWDDAALTQLLVERLALGQR